MEPPIVFFFFEFEFDGLVFVLFEDSPAFLTLVEDASVASPEDYFVFFVDLEAIVGEVLVEHLALVVEVGIVLILKLYQ